MGYPPLSSYSPAAKNEFQNITDDQYNQYVKLFEDSKQQYRAHITSVNSMELRNLAQGEAGRAEDYHECNEWVQLELNNLQKAWEKRILVLFDKASKGEIFDV